MIIGLDVGGTHTDAVLLGAEGVVASVKAATEPDDLFGTLLHALGELAQNESIDQVERLVLSTTLATNLVVQQQLPQVAVIVAAGPGIDPGSHRIGDHYHIVRGALDHSGRELTPIDEDEIHKIGEQLRSAGVEYGAVVSKFSIRNPSHEQRIANLLSGYLRQVFTGHSLSGTLSFPRRITTTYLNAAVARVHTDFFTAVRKFLKDHGLNMPIHILKPDGGNMNVESSVSYPAQTILSGPSASVMGALASAKPDTTCLVLDIGGTTTDMAVIINGAPVIAPHGIEIGPFKTLIRALWTNSIGLGGDSVVRVANGKVSIGPERKGVAMAFGGPVVTPTDALCLLGEVEGADREKAAEGIRQLAVALGRDINQTAELIFEEACRQILDGADKMIRQINSRPVYTVHEMLADVEVRPDYILVLGGPAARFAGKLGEMFAGQVATVPHWQVANAIGCALSRTTCEMTVYADTSRNLITTQDGEYTQTVSGEMDLEDVREIAFKLVREKALRRGANPDDLQIEVIEESQFAMIRGFNRIGRNIRVRAQVKPGLISGAAV